MRLLKYTATIILFSALSLQSVMGQSSDKRDDERASRIAEDVTEAVKKFGLAEEEARTKLLVAIDSQSERVEGNKRLSVEDKLAALEELKAAREAFETSGHVPEARVLRNAVLNYKRSIENALRTCTRTYERAISEYGRMGELDAAKALVDELDEFKRTRGIVSNDAFQPETRWVGEYSRFTSGGQREKGPFELTVLTREGDRFTARINLDNKVVFVATGSIKDNRIGWSGNDIVHEKGIARHSYIGMFDSKKLQLEYGGVVARNERMAVMGTVIANRVKE